MEAMTREPFDYIRDLCPHLSDDELGQAHDRFMASIVLMWSVVERMKYEQPL